MAIGGECGLIIPSTMNMAAGLTQVPSDGSNTYLYGNDRIAQINGTDTDYFLGHALGSVRQMANESGAVVYAASYDPYGHVVSTNGDVQTSYGYAGENTDSYIKWRCRKGRRLNFSAA
jgi:hypothetical protein